MIHALLTNELDPTDKTLIASHEGGKVYQATDAVVLERFLIMGSFGTFYANAKEVTEQTINQIKLYAEAKPEEMLPILEKVMRDKLAYRRDPSLLVLAILLRNSKLEVRRTAENIAAMYVKTGTDILHLASYLKLMGGWNTITRRVLKTWFTTTHTNESLALQAVKYESRDGWGLRDLIRLSHPLTQDPVRRIIFDFIAHPDKRDALKVDTELQEHPALSILRGWAIVRREDLDAEKLAAAVGKFRVPREAVPGPLLAKKEIWQALEPDMPAQALVRNLGKLASLEIDKGKYAHVIAQRIEKSAEFLHPVQFLLARKVYAQGRGEKGSLAWTPSAPVTQALDRAFLASFDALPRNLEVRPLIALDVSASMSATTNGTVLTCYEAEAALTLVLKAQFPNASFVAFSHKLMAFIPPSGPRQFDDMMRVLDGTPMGGGTDCRLPLQVAERSDQFDSVVTMTDSETGVFPFNHYGRARQADVTVASLMRDIHKQPGREHFRNAVVAFQMNDISIADPADPRQMDFVGMSADLPKALTQFLSGEL